MQNNIANFQSDVDKEYLPESLDLQKQAILSLFPGAKVTPFFPDGNLEKQLDGVDWEVSHEEKTFSVDIKMVYRNQRRYWVNQNDIELPMEHSSECYGRRSNGWLKDPKKKNDFIIWIVEGQEQGHYEYVLMDFAKAKAFYGTQAYDEAIVSRKGKQKRDMKSTPSVNAKGVTWVAIFDVLPVSALRNAGVVI